MSLPNCTKTFPSAAIFGIIATLVCALPAGAYIDPTTGLPHASDVTRPFDKPEKNWLSGHRGVDLGANPGQPIVAAEAGVVAFRGTIAGAPTLSIIHGDGIRTTYQPVHSHLNEGDVVEEGQFIGTLGAPFDDHPGLHWGALIGKDDYINPLSLLSRPTIRLKR